MPVKITRDDDVAEDLVQELFINLWDKRQALNFTSSVSSCFYTAVRYKFFDLVEQAEGPGGLPAEHPVSSWTREAYAIPTIIWMKGTECYNRKALYQTAGKCGQFSC